MRSTVTKKLAWDIAINILLLISNISSEEFVRHYIESNIREVAKPNLEINETDTNVYFFNFLCISEGTNKDDLFCDLFNLNISIFLVKFKKPDRMMLYNRLNLKILRRIRMEELLIDLLSYLSLKHM